MQRRFAVKVRKSRGQQIAAGAVRGFAMFVAVLVLYEVCFRAWALLLYEPVDIASDEVFPAPVPWLFRSRVELGLGPVLIGLSRETRVRWEGPFVWEAEDRYENANLFSRERFFHGRQCGPVKVWHANGRLWQDGEALGGRLHGEWRVWSPEGALMASFRMRQGTGTVPEFRWDTGTKFRETDYLRGNVVVVRSWYPNGVLRATRRYGPGVHDYCSQEWNELGVLIAEGREKDWCREGRFVADGRGASGTALRVVLEWRADRPVAVWALNGQPFTGQIADLPLGAPLSSADLQFRNGKLVGVTAGGQSLCPSLWQHLPIAAGP